MHNNLLVSRIQFYIYCAGTVVILVSQRSINQSMIFTPPLELCVYYGRKTEKKKKIHTHIIIAGTLTHTWIVCIGRSLVGPCSSHNIITAAAAAHSSPLFPIVGCGCTAAVVSHARSCIVQLREHVRIDKLQVCSSIRTTGFFFSVLRALSDAYLIIILQVCNVMCW